LHAPYGCYMMRCHLGYVHGYAAHTTILLSYKSLSLLHEPLLM
jgi:hypothetical protein